MMEKKVAILKHDNETGKKEVYYIIYDSIFDIRRKADNIYAMKKLIELEKLAKEDPSIKYEFKLIDEDELQAYLANCEINDKMPVNTGSYFNFLIYHARQIDELMNKSPSNINMQNYDHRSLICWIKKCIKEFEDNQITIQTMKKG